MASVTHDVLVRIVRRRPDLVPFLLYAAGHTVPVTVVRLIESQLSADAVSEAADTSDGRPRRWRLRLADVVVQCGEDDDQRVVVCEVQTSKPSNRQRRRQHTYLAVTADVNDCKSILMVLTVNDAVARACGRAYLPGHPKLVLIPVVLGPGNTPPPDAPGTEGFEAELAVLSVLNGNLDISDPATCDRVVATIDKTGRWPGEYTGFLWDSAAPTARKLLEEAMKKKPYYALPFMEEARIQGKAEGKAQGKAEGTAEALLTIMEARGISVPEAIEQQIRLCQDADQLCRWTVLAANADTIADVFPGPKPRRKTGRDVHESAA